MDDRMVGAVQDGAGMILQNKTILLGVGSGPLTWLAVDVLRGLQRAGAHVHVILGAEAEAFVPALTFQTLAGEVVWPAQACYGMMAGGHFRSLAALMADIDAMVVVPANPALLAKTAMTCADEALIRAILLHTGPTIMAYPGQARPYRHRLVQRQLAVLRDANIVLWDEAVRETEDATDELGWVMSPSEIVAVVARQLSSPVSVMHKETS
jgi:phosphopantothenoylcysteine decarboxylase / phosphopantothenate---cysteine ligase